MGFRLRITFKTERTYIVLTTLPIAGWCEECGARSSFVDEERETATISLLPEAAGEVHRTILHGRRLVCLRSLTPEP